MARSFEDIDMWKKARELVKIIYQFTNSKKFSKDLILTGQIRRAAISVMSNIAEGFERGSNTEFIQFLYIAKGSAGEVRAQLYAGLDQAYLTETEFQCGRELCVNISGQISGMINYLKGSKLKGEKFNTELTGIREEAQKLES
jgi:four helix bundle protein